MKLKLILTLVISVFSNFAMAASESALCNIPSQNLVIGANYNGTNLDFYVQQGNRKETAKGANYVVLSQAQAKSNQAVTYASQQARIDLNQISTVSVFVLSANNEGSMTLLKYNPVSKSQKPVIVYFALSTVIRCQ